MSYVLETRAGAKVDDNECGRTAPNKKNPVVFPVSPLVRSPLSCLLSSLFSPHHSARSAHCLCALLSNGDLRSANERGLHTDGANWKAQTPRLCCMKGMTPGPGVKGGYHVCAPPRGCLIHPHGCFGRHMPQGCSRVVEGLKVTGTLSHSEDTKVNKVRDLHRN